MGPRVGRSRCPGAAGRSPLCSAPPTRGLRSGGCLLQRVLPSFSAVAHKSSSRSLKQRSKSSLLKRVETSSTSTSATKGSRPICQRCKDTSGPPTSRAHTRRGSDGVTISRTWWSGPRFLVTRWRTGFSG